MSLTSIYFLIFAVLLVPLFYLVPKKAQWYILLAASIVFYVFSGWTNISYVLFAAASAYCATTFMQKLKDKQNVFIKENKDTLSKDEKKTYKQKIKNKRKAIMLACIILNICILIFFKIFSRLKLSIETLDSWNIIVPLGLSYFTLQTIGYVVDVYWNNVEAEKNPLKLLLFVSFFPQMTQGPISDFKQLTGELFKEHTLTYENFSWGFQRIVWGYFKKLVVANLMSPYVTDLFENYQSYSGITLFIGMFVVMIQLYADFSGYMDIVCGLCEMLDIRLSENFNAPFFSKSLSEFWRRWHITLGAWFKKYVFFTVATSRFATFISKKAKNKFSSDVAEKMVSTIALLAIWILIGAWHSLILSFILWGLLNGLIMIFSVWMEPVYAKIRNTLHIKETSKLFNLFRMARTFTLVSALEVFSDTMSLKKTLEYFFSLLRNILVFPRTFTQLFPYLPNLELTPVKSFIANFLTCTSEEHKIVVLFMGILCIFVIDMIEGKCSFRAIFNQLPTIIRLLFLAFVFLIVMNVGIQATIATNGGFLYAEF